MDIKDKQSLLFKKILNVSALDSQMQLSSPQQFPSNWKILVYDEHTFNFLSYLKTRDLRENNVTMHVTLGSQKEELLGVEAIYFIYPSRESLAQTLQDIKSNYFDKYFICFSQAIPTSDLKGFCDQIIKMGKTQLVQKLIQVNMVHFLFCDSGFTFLLPLLEEEKLVASLLNFVLFLGELPVFCWEKQDQFALNLVEKVRLALEGKEYSFEKPKPSRRTLFFVLENQNSFTNMLHHFTYFHLILDCFPILLSEKEFNLVLLEKKKVSLNFVEDFFLKENLFSDYPTVGDKLYASMLEWKQKYEKITAKNDKEDIADGMSEAIENLPQITEDNKVYQNHLQISSVLMKKIDERRLEKFAAIGNRVVQDKKISQEYFAEAKLLFSDQTLKASDKVRFFIILAVYAGLTPQQYEELEEQITQHGKLNERETTLIGSLREKFKDRNSQSSLFKSLKSSSLNFVSKLLKSQYLYRSS